MLKSSAYPKEEKMLNNLITLLAKKMKDGLWDGNQTVRRFGCGEDLGKL